MTVSPQLMQRIRQSMAERGLQIALTDSTRELLVENGWDPAMGARPLRRAIQRFIEDPLADFILRSEPVEGQLITIDRSKDADGADRWHLHQLREDSGRGPGEGSGQAQSRGGKPALKSVLRVSCSCGLAPRL